ncbi:MAG: hypothetical protein IPK16_31310 [Anaerolineales bacterium]|nr:hypothetical protein [Anaerolineales bacterium]
MASQPGNSPVLVYNAKTFAQMLHTLRQRTLLALDTESDSLYSYYPKVCLIQISAYASAQPEGPLDVVDYLVDPLRLPDLKGLGELLATPGIETVMHAAENDMLILHRNYGFKFHCVFDTQLAAHPGLATGRPGGNP